jgi:type I restriction enzyme S subunit
MHHLFTHGPVPVDQAEQVPLKETEIGLVPFHWTITTIDNIATEVRSGVTPRGGASTYLSEGIPLLRSQNIRMNRLALDDVAFISPQTHERMSRSATKAGDVLLNITGASIGRVATVPESLPTANVNQHVCRIRVGAAVCPQFLSYFLSTGVGQQQILGSQYGTTRQGLNYGQVRSLRIPLPPFEEQKHVADGLATADQKIEKEEARQIAQAVSSVLSSTISCLELSASPRLSPSSRSHADGSLVG